MGVSQKSAIILLEPRDSIVLIHGTFAKNKDWRPFSSLLKASLAPYGLAEINILTFRWSGENSEQARIDAGKDLSDFIQNLGPNSAVHLLAHSHGGNVALRSLNRNTRALIKSLIFMGTPFLTPKLRAFEALSDLYSGAISWLLFLVLAFTMLCCIIVESIVAPRVEYLEQITILITIAISGWYFLFARPHIAASLNARMRTYLMACRDTWLSRTAQPEPNQPTCIATVSGDEARIWLRGIHAVTSSPWYALKFIGGSLIWLPIAYGCIYAGKTEKYLAHPTPLFAPSPGTLFALMFVLIFVLPFISIGVAALLHGHRFSFGERGLFTPIFGFVEPSAVPEWRLPPGSIRLSIGFRRTKGLRHSLFYEDSNLLTQIADWLCTPLQNETKDKWRYVAPFEFRIADLRAPVAGMIVAWVIWCLYQGFSLPSIFSIFLLLISLVFWALIRATRLSMQRRSNY